MDDKKDLISEETNHKRKTKEGEKQHLLHRFQEGILHGLNRLKQKRNNKRKSWSFFQKVGCISSPEQNQLLQNFVETCPLGQHRATTAGRSRKVGVSERCEFDRTIVLLVMAEAELEETLLDI